MKTKRELGEGKMLPLVLSMAMPLVLSMAFQAVYNITDSLFISHYSSIAFAGVTLVEPLVFLSQTIANGIGTGTSSLLSKCLGERDNEKARKAVGTGWAVSCIACVFFFLAYLFFAKPFVRFFTTDVEAAVAGRSYLQVFALGIPFLFLSAMCSFLLQSHGDTKASMKILVSGSVLNIALDPVFVFLLDLGATGAAIATVIGHAASAIIGVALLVRRQVNAKVLLFDAASAKRILFIALPAFLSTGAGSLTSLVINKLIIGYGVEEMVVYGMYLKMESFLFLAAHGVSSALVVIAAYNFGQRTMDRVKSAYRYSLVIGWIAMILGFVLLQAFAPHLVRLFASDTALIGRGVVCFRITSLCLLFSSVNIITQGLMQGLGKGFRSLFLGYMRFFMFLIPFAFLLSHFFGVRGIYASYFAADVPTLLLDFIVYQRTRKEMLES